jgi:hypothetical protein
MVWVHLQAKPSVHRIEQGEAEQAPFSVFPKADDALGIVGDQGVPQAPHDVADVQVAGAVRLRPGAHQEAPHRFEVAFVPVWSRQSAHGGDVLTRRGAGQRHGGPSRASAVADFS